MDAELIHQRDVSAILNQLQDDLKNVYEKHQHNPTTKEELNKEVQDLISTADRDLRLKTQAIVRARLSKSRILPLSMGKPKKDPNFMQHAHSALANPLPPLKPLKETSFEKMIENNAPQPIPPIATHTEQRFCTAVTPARLRKIPDFTPALPKRDLHDPGAPLPEIDPKIIPKYGLNRLEESGLISNRVVKDQLKDLVTVSPFVYDFTKSIKKEDDMSAYKLDKDSAYKLDKDHEEIQKEKERPPTEEKTQIEAVQTEDEKPLFPGGHTHLRLQFLNGEPLTVTQDYRAFKKEHQNVWEQIEIIFQLLKKACYTYGFSKVMVDANAVLDLLQYDPDEISEERLLLCFIDIPAEKDRKKRTKAGVGFVGPNAENIAATVIQSVWRGFYARREVRMIRRTGAAVRIIQRWYRNMMQIKQFS